MLSRLFVALMVGLILSVGVGTVVMAAESFEGKVLTTSDDHHLTVQVGDDQRVFVVNDQTAITLDGNGARWQDLKPGFTVSVQADADGNRWVAKSIAAYADQ
jgi:hypothetical protein